jgi:hypothetical protein
MRYVKTFVVSAPCFAVFYHYITADGPHPVRWWPDSVIMGLFMGILATLVLLRLTFAHRALRALWNAGRALVAIARGQ